MSSKTLEQAWDSFVDDMNAEMEVSNLPPVSGGLLVSMKAAFFNGASATRRLIADGCGARVDWDLSHSEELLLKTLKFEKQKQ